MNLYVDVPRAPATSSRLTRSQVAQKIGSHSNGYPRPTGVLVPRALADLYPTLADSTQSRRQRGRDVVLRIERSLRRLPPAVLERAMPHPSTVLSALPIEDRTRSVLDRLLPLIAKEPTWTVERYLRIPQFGARCLVDLLAACEERALDAGPGKAARTLVDAGADSARTVVPFTPVDLGRLDDIARLLARLLPISGAELGRVLVDEGVASAPVALAHLIAVYRGLDRPIPFRMVMCGGMEIAVAADNHGFAATVTSTAVRLVSHWGLSTVDSLINRVAVLRSAPANRAFACRLLVALPRLRWLDDAMEWFSFLGDRSRLARAIAKMFAVARRVSIRDLRRALEKGRARGPELPTPVLERYLEDIAGCQIEDGLVSIGQPARG